MLVEPRLTTIGDIIGWEYTVVFCQISNISPRMAIYRDAYMYAVGILFEKYRRDVAFVMVKVEDHLQLVQENGFQNYNSFGFFNPFTKNPFKQFNFDDISEDELESFDFYIDKNLKERRILSEEELNHSNVPLNEFYPRFEEKSGREEKEKYVFDIEFNRNLLKSLVELNNMNMGVQSQMKVLQKKYQLILRG